MKLYHALQKNLIVLDRNASNHITAFKLFILRIFYLKLRDDYYYQLGLVPLKERRVTLLLRVDMS